MSFTPTTPTMYPISSTKTNLTYPPPQFQEPLHQPHPPLIFRPKHPGYQTHTHTPRPLNKTSQTHSYFALEHKHPSNTPAPSLTLTGMLGPAGWENKRHRTPKQEMHHWGLSEGFIRLVAPLQRTGVVPWTTGWSKWKLCWEVSCMHAIQEKVTCRCVYWCVNMWYIDKGELKEMRVAIENAANSNWESNNRKKT